MLMHSKACQLCKMKFHDQKNNVSKLIKYNNISRVLQGIF